MTHIEDLWPHYPRLIPIPKIFHSLEHDGPFRTCLQCGGDLHQADRYLIERVFKGREPIVEYAMCSSCVEGASTDLSAESLEAVRKYFLENADLQSRVDRLRPLAEEDDVTPWLSECLFTGTTSGDCQERQICGWFEGDQLRLDFAPFMLSGKAVEAISEQLSEQTRGWMEDFVGDNFWAAVRVLRRPEHDASSDLSGPASSGGKVCQLSGPQLLSGPHLLCRLCLSCRLCLRCDAGYSE